MGVVFRTSKQTIAQIAFAELTRAVSPTHANKRGVRYRYYVSHAILQNRKTEAR